MEKHHLDMFVNSLPSHVFPLKVPGQVHVKEAPLFLQIPSFLHGFESHGLGAKKQQKSNCCHLKVGKNGYGSKGYNYPATFVFEGNLSARTIMYSRLIYTDEFIQ